MLIDAVEESGESREDIGIEKRDEIAKKYRDMITKQDKELEKQWLEERERTEKNTTDSIKTVQTRRRTRTEP